MSVNLHTLSISLVLFAALIATIALWRRVDRRQSTQADQHWTRAFQGEVNSRPLPAWNGQGWPENVPVNQYLNDPWLASAQWEPALASTRAWEQSPVLADTRAEVMALTPQFTPTQVLPVVTAQALPPGPASGPGLDAELDTDAFIASMRAETDRWISYYSMTELAGV